MNRFLSRFGPRPALCLAFLVALLTGCGSQTPPGSSQVDTVVVQPSPVSDPLDSQALSTGTVAGWGDTTIGQLSLSPGNVVAISAGTYYNLALRSDGTVVGWGSAGYGQATMPADLNNGVIAISAGLDHGLATRNDGKVVAWGHDEFEKLNVPPDLSGVVAVAAGWFHSVALKSDGTVVAWGDNRFNQLDIPDRATDIVAISAGVNHTLALRRDGTVVAWGSASFGQISVPFSLNNVVAIEAGAEHSMALKSDGTVVAWGADKYKQSTIPDGLGDVVAISGGHFHSLALKSDGKVVAWGAVADPGVNTYGVLDVPPTLSHVGAISAGYLHNIVLVDTTPPTVTLNQASEQADPTNANPIGFTATFSEPVRGFTASDVSLGGTADLSGASVSLSGGPETYTVSVSGIAGSGTVVASIPAGAATDGAANPSGASTSTDNTVTFVPDTTPPGVTINQAAGQADPTNANPVLFTATFSEAVTGFDSSDVSLSGTANLSGASVVVSGGPTVYTLSVSGVAGNGTVIASLPANAATDSVGNPSSASTSTDNTVTFLSDSTPPVITPNITGTLGTNGWYRSDVNLNWTVTDPESAVSNTSGCDPQSVTADTTGVTLTCSATSAGGTGSQSVTIKRDVTAPTITLIRRTAPNAAGWNNTNVTVEWQCADATSLSTIHRTSWTLIREGVNQSLTGDCTDFAGNTASDTQTGINIDKTAPTLNPVVSPNPVPLNGSATVVSNASDALSGLASQGCGSLNISTVGTKSVSCTATDNAGNTNTVSVNYNVIFVFSGFFSPVANLPTVNVAKAGNSIPLKFSLGGNQGLNILASGYPKATRVTCTSTATKSNMGSVATPGSSSLQYDPLTNTYIYVWKTNKRDVGCWLLTVRLSDGTDHQAAFELR